MKALAQRAARTASAEPAERAPFAHELGLDDAQLAADLGRSLSARLRLASAEHPVATSALFPGELERLRGFEIEARRLEWRRGRAALKKLLRALGEREDTSLLRFPHPRISLTHSGPRALAVALEPGQPLDGVGLDLETGRLRPEAARLFLDAREQAWLGALPEGAFAEALVKLWSLKEALFKADPGNATTGLHEYHIETPSHAAGFATRDGLSFRWTTRRLDAVGRLSVAILERRQ